MKKKVGYFEFSGKSLSLVGSKANYQITDSFFYIELGKAIKTERIKKGLNRRQFSKIIQFETEQLKSLERGSARISIFTLYAISEILNINLNEFFNNVRKKAYNKEIRRIYFGI